MGDLRLDSFKDLERFERIGNGMAHRDQGRWVRLSDVQAMWISFIKDLGDAIIGLGMEVKTEALESEKVLREEEGS